MQRRAQPIQNIGAVGFAFPVVHRMQGWVSNAGFFLEPVAGPALAFERFLQRANNHA